MGNEAVGARRYRLLLTSWRRSRTGSIQSVLYLAEGLRRRGHAVWVACSPDGFLAPRLRAAEVPILPIDFGRGWSLSAAGRIARFVRDREIELIDAQDSQDRKAAILARVVYRAPARLVITRRQMTASHRIALKIYDAAADRIIAISEGVAKTLVAGGTSADRISVVHTGLDPRRMQGEVDESELRALREELGIDPALPTVGAVSRRKDQETLVRAAALLGRPINLLFVGIQQDASLRALEKDLPDGVRVSYAGFREPVLPLYRLLDVKVLPTLREGLSQAILEAQAAGVPVITAAVGGTPEVIEDGVNGLHFPPGDAASLAHALERVLDDRDLRVRLAEAGRSRVRERFSADRLAERTEAVYRFVLEGRTGSLADA